MPCTAPACDCPFNQHYFANPAHSTIDGFCRCGHSTSEHHSAVSSLEEGPSPDNLDVRIGIFDERNQVSPLPSPPRTSISSPSRPLQYLELNPTDAPTIVRSQGERRRRCRLLFGLPFLAVVVVGVYFAVYGASLPNQDRTY